MTSERLSSPHPLRAPSAWLPIAMSLVCCALVLQHVFRQLPPETDEGTAAHLWQILMAAQAPIVIWFAASRLPRDPRRGAIVLALQACAFAASLALLWWMEHAGR